MWTYDIIEDRLADGSIFRMLCVLDEFTRECLAIYVARTIRAADVIRILQVIMDVQVRKPEFIRSDNGGQFAANDVMAWLSEHMVGPAFIDPGCPWQNGFVESFHGKFRDECLNREWFKSIQEAVIVIEQWRQFYNAERPHSSLNYLTLDTSCIRRPARSHAGTRVQQSLLSEDYHFVWPQKRAQVTRG